MKIKIISEDELLEMIRTRPGDDGESSTSKATPEKLKRKSSSSSTTTAKKTTIDPEPSKTTVDDSNLLCKSLLHV